MNTNKGFDNQFDGLDIYGRDKVQIFTFLHIESMEAKKIALPFLVPLIGPTRLIYDAMYGNTSDKGADIKQRMAQTKEVKKAIKDFKVAARRVFARTIDKVGVDSPIYTELFSDGMTTINKIKMENAYLTIDVLKNGTVKYTTELGADMVTLIDDCYTVFDTARKAQMHLHTIVEDSNPLYDVNYKLMKKQLNKNYHTICLQNGDNPQENYIFFNDSVLETPSHRKGKDNYGPWVRAIQPLTEIDSLIAFSLGQKITIKNLCNIPIYYMGAVSATEPFQPSSLMIMPGEEITITAVQLGCPVNKFLLLANKDATQLGVVKITLS